MFCHFAFHAAAKMGLRVRVRVRVMVMVLVLVRVRLVPLRAAHSREC